MFSETFQNVTIGETMEKAVGQAVSIMLREVGTSHGVGFGFPVEKNYFPELKGQLNRCAL